MSPFTPALRLHDRYVLRERIGLGGMSEVWRADDPVLHRPVAVKALVAQLAADPELRATIQREARAAARLTHPHVTQVYDYGEATLPGGAVVPYLVMELVDGENLADRLTRGPLAWPDAVRLGGQVAAALAAAHRIGVIHHDVKPANVMLTDTGAKVLDFGIAALTGPRHPRAGQDRGGLLMGTPAYLAPERLAAAPPDPASDVYALGVLLYSTLTGRLPRSVRNWEEALAVHVCGTPVPPLGIPELPTDIARLVMACLAAEPDRRPGAATVAARLGAGRPDHPPTTVLPTLPATAAHPPTLIERAPILGRTDPPGPGFASPVPTGSPASPPSRPSSSAPVAAGPPTRRGNGSNRLLGALVATGLALLVGLVGVFVLGDGSGGPRDAGPATAAPAAATPPVATAPTPTAGRPAPTTLRGLAAELTATIDAAEGRGSIDADTAEKLREKVAELADAKPKDRAKRLRDLRERLDKAAEEEQIDDGTADRLLTLLEQYGTPRNGSRDDD